MHNFSSWVKWLCAAKAPLRVHFLDMFEYVQINDRSIDKISPDWNWEIVSPLLAQSALVAFPMRKAELLWYCRDLELPLCWHLKYCAPSHIWLIPTVIKSELERSHNGKEPHSKCLSARTCVNITVTEISLEEVCGLHRGLLPATSCLSYH